MIGRRGFIAELMKNFALAVLLLELLVFGSGCVIAMLIGMTEHRPIVVIAGFLGVALDLALVLTYVNWQSR